MPQLSLTKEYQSGTNASIGVSGHEPNGEFWTYRVNDIDNLENSVAQPDLSEFYPFAEPDTEKLPLIAITPIDNMGVKKFIGWGAGAYYHPMESEYSYLVLPIHKKMNEQEPPNVDITNNGNTVIFDIEPSSTYETARLTVKKGNLREEKVVYLKKNQNTRYEMTVAFSGMVVASIRTHANEINVVSKMAEVELNLGGVLESIFTIRQSSASLFNHNTDIIKFYDNGGMVIENIELVREVDGEYDTASATVYNAIENANWGEHTGSTALTLSLSCEVDDTVIAFVTTRSSATFSAGWTVVAETAFFSTLNQKLFCLKKVATSTTESITVTQSSSARIYIELLSTKATLDSTAFVNTTGGAVDTYTSVKANKQNANDIVLWGVSVNLYPTSSPYGKMSISPNTNTVLYSSGIDNQDRQAIFWDNNSTLEKTFAFSGDGTTNTGYGLLGIKLIPTVVPDPSEAIIKTIPIPDRSIYDDDYVIELSEE